MTVEKIADGNLLDDPVLAAGMLPGFYVEAIAVAERRLAAGAAGSLFRRRRRISPICANGRDGGRLSRAYLDEYVSERQRCARSMTTFRAPRSCCIAT